MNSQTLKADTRPTKELLVNGITKDLSIEACIFDLIDNAIDGHAKNVKGKVEITFAPDFLKIQDYGVGIEESELVEKVMRIGSISSPKDGIGIFGVGLKRALFKLANKARVVTETTNNRLVINFDKRVFLRDDDDWTLPISRENKTNQNGTCVLIEDLDEALAQCISDKKWCDDIAAEISKRYAYLISENTCEIFINDNLTQASITPLRDDGLFKIREKSFELNDVAVTVKLGQHKDHRLTKELGYDSQINKMLSNQFGWSIFCNKRGILMNDASPKTGWAVKEHSQHHGWVGHVTMLGDPSKLPWSTSKVDIDLTNEIYIKALQVMADFGDQWRSFTDQQKKSKQSANSPKTDDKTGNLFDPPITEAQAEPSQESASSGEDSPTQESAKIDPAKSNPIKGGGFNTKTHPSAQAYLFGPTKTTRLQFDAPINAIKLSAIITELKTLELAVYPCAILMLLRSLIEESCKYYVKANSGKPNYPLNTALKDQVSSCTDSMKGRNLINGHEFSAIKALCSARGKDVVSIENMQLGIHSDRMPFGASEIRSFWQAIGPFVIAALKN